MDPTATALSLDWGETPTRTYPGAYVMSCSSYPCHTSAMVLLLLVIHAQ